DERGVGDAGQGTGLQRGGADLLERDGPEDLAEAGNDPVQQGSYRFGRGIAAGETGTAGGNDHVDVRVGDPAGDQRTQPVAVVRQQLPVTKPVAGSGNRLHEVVAAGIGVQAARIGDRQDGD